MRTREIMTENPACCTRDTKLQDVAQLMVEHDCGEIPVIDNWQKKKPVGVVTDRDITCRIVAAGKNPITMTVGDCMSSPVITIALETSLEECCKVMEENQVRRLPVVDAKGTCCGIVSQADIAQHAPKETAELVREVSRGEVSPSHV